MWASRSPSVDKDEHEPSAKQGRTAEGGGLSVRKHRHAQLAQVCRLGDRIDGDDLASPDGETQEEQEPPTRGNNDSHRSVYEHRRREREATQERPRSPVYA